MRAALVIVLFGLNNPRLLGIMAARTRLCDNMRFRARHVLRKLCCTFSSRGQLVLVLMSQGQNSVSRYDVCGQISR
jgi:hypothetical protein